MSDNSQNRQAGALQPLHIVARMFAAFSFVLAVVALLSFWPPKSPAVVVWLLLWIGVCLSTTIAILWRARYAPTIVWILNIVAGLSALAALRSGLLRGVGVLIDIVLFIPLVGFAIWYQRNRRVESAATGRLGRSE